MRVEAELGLAFALFGREGPLGDVDLRDAAIHFVGQRRLSFLNLGDVINVLRGQDA